MRLKIKDLERKHKSAPINKQNTAGDDEKHKT